MGVGVEAGQPRGKNSDKHKTISPIIDPGKDRQFLEYTIYIFIGCGGKKRAFLWQPENAKRILR